MALISALDQAPRRAVRPAGSPHPIAETITLARDLDELGFHRYWLAEHHVGFGFSLPAPEVVIAQVAAATRHLRVGSGGMLLPNHRPMHVAEQFRTLESLHPGRIDLGVGRSDGAADPAMAQALGRATDNGHGAGFDQQLSELLAFGDVLPLAPDHPLAQLRASPRDVPLPPITLLGSSVNSARTAARRGLGYGFAAYTNPDGAAEALHVYREQFVAARPGDRPHAILALKVLVGEDDDHAEALDAPLTLALAQFLAGQPSSLLTVEQAAAHRWTEAELAVRHRVDLRADVVGGPQRVRAGLEAHLAATGADEIIATSNTTDPADRRASFVRLAEVMELRAPGA
jgi:luciferase family oxidoreductase group 1